MPMNDDSPKFTDILRTSWVKSAIKIGIIFVIIGFMIFVLIRVLNVGNTQLYLAAKAFAIKHGLLGIFFATLIAGTILPLGSPGLVLIADILGVPEIPLILVATVGFTIGMMVNYGLAFRFGRAYVLKKVSDKSLEEAMHFWSRWGWILYSIFGLIPVLPVELLSFACGLLRTRFDFFIILTFIPRLIVFTIIAFFGDVLGLWMGIA